MSMPVTAATGAVVRTPRSSDGTYIYAEAVGNPRNPHVVFVHEATLCASVFDELFEDSRLTDHLFMVRYDLRCHGRSGTVKGAQSQSSNLYAADFAAVMGAFGLQRPIVVAWGFGAAVVADICAHASPPPVAGVVFVAPLPFLGAAMTYAVAPPMADVVQTLGVAKDAAALGRAKTVFVDALFAGPARRIPDSTKAAWLGRSVAQEPEATNNVFCRVHDAARLLDAGRRGLPLMVLVGAEDVLVDSSAVVRELRRHFRNSEAHVVAGGSHALFVDRRDEFVKHLLMFVGRLAVMTLMG
ncbi:hypothetical protein GSI_14941 [Ganoderma sinense ZZ0214-1]|uniref:AB hydrolase-1 domain-containing protein n=1 Tax=Ganoderma sinense ZZ0214-1 TaxID=1077348 RepID=A0A2G8RQK8_9APHY|nr:hypothetical protein GSI_14941 [Ganoderma sinense ZZ0214-1]